MGSNRRFCYVEGPGLGLAVEGSAYSVGLCFSDARRQGEATVWLKSVDGGLVGLGTDVRWDVAEVDHA